MLGAGKFRARDNTVVTFSQTPFFVTVHAFLLLLCFMSLFSALELFSSGKRFGSRRGVRGCEQLSGSSLPNNLGAKIPNYFWDFNRPAPPSEAEARERETIASYDTGDVLTRKKRVPVSNWRCHISHESPTINNSTWRPKGENASVTRWIGMGKNLWILARRI